MKKILLFSFFICLSFLCQSQSKYDIEGIWLEEEGQSKIKIFSLETEKYGTMYGGRIIWLAEPFTEDGEIKRDTKSFSSALKAALREDPDIIYIGEMRDLETIQLAITAAETGHLVLGTLHTSSAAKTVERIVDVFPADQQEQARLQVSTSLAGIMSQTLCKNQFGKRSLAYELLINTPAISNLVRERKVSQIYSQLQTGGKEGMNTLEQCLQILIDKKEISLEEGISKSSNPKILINN